MGHVKRKTFTRPLPAGAEIVSKNGGEYAEWLGRNGKKRTAPVTTGRDGSPRVRIETRTYTAIYCDGKGLIREYATGCRARRSAETVLARLEQEAEKIRAGILSATESEMTKHQNTPLSEHIDNYINHQTAKGVNPQRVRNTRSRLLRLADECNIHRLSDLTGDALERWLLDKAELDDRTKKPMGAGAGIPKRDSRGRTVDIHALRHTFGTMLSAAGVRPRTAQEAMRHSTLDLTMNVYTDPALLDVAGAIEALPNFTIGRAAELEEENSDDDPARVLAPVLALNTHRSGQSGSIPVKMAVPDTPPPILHSLAVKSCYDNSKGPLSTADSEPFKSGRLDLNQRPLRPERDAPHVRRSRRRPSEGKERRQDARIVS